ncbi:PEP-CTERM sorting domain-containing protein [Mariniblastus fucicola]|uniref:Ice-binding protein C-terminal domain-containing protein n=1 Tax=Mariniblastus fucicola TaxID=980251 RepID=A0A5B9PC99_9BACT|nr:PEP-CTERM sorting domain-containing protein [Mariniblastus fucicola]QEG23874.1 hypothetical protein MFFC18_37780 [Mariniblastus fucicola]
MLRPLTCFAASLTIALISLSTANADDVVAFWGWTNDYDFSATAPTKMDFAGDVDNTVAGDANLQIFLGDAANFDHNGGGGFVSYTSAASGITYDPTRTAKWDDLKGGGDDFDIGGNSSFMVDKNDGAGALADDFGNDALMYLTIDGSGYQDFQFRFDIESTPGDLAESFDVFYRVGGNGTWFRDTAQNNIPLSYMDYPTADPENQFADSGFISLNSMLNNQSQIEIIVSDFAEFGNSELEIDNFEITAVAVPEPTSGVLLIVLATAGLVQRRRK